MDELFDAVVIGGGPGGSVSASSIAAAGYSVALLEKQVFPRETLCGEFLSSEVVGMITAMGLEREFRALLPNPLRTLTLLPERNSPVRTSLGFTAYGVRRSVFDSMLLEAASNAGVRLIQPAEVIAIEKDHRGFVVHYRNGREAGTCHGHWVVGAYGKRSPLDGRLGRMWASVRTGYVGFKYHVPDGMIENLGDDEIAIAFGPRIYCGVSRVGGRTATICALQRREKGDMSTREQVRALARANPRFELIVPPAVLDNLATMPVYGTASLFFGNREIVVNGILMVGDAAGLIAPLAGDGIGIAMEQGRLLGRLFAEMHPRPADRESFAETYRRKSALLFARRKRVALICQHIALSEAMRPALAPFLSFTPGLLKAAIGATRGRTGKHETLATP
jgi:menaquinone-9 beta-reductase